jgi:predicted O-methyltransferase YrrM
LHDRRSIPFQDFGAGSKRVKNKRPRISQLAKNSLKPPKYARLICQLAQYIQAKNIIELGTSLGTTTLYLAKGNPEATIYSIEGSTAVAGIAKEQFKLLECKNIDLRTGVFDDVLPQLLSESDAIDFVFIDGNHTKAATLRYFEMVLPRLNSNALVVFDDINWSDEMREAWEELKARPEVRLSMDFFFLGVVSVNPGLSKEDFLIRY